MEALARYTRYHCVSPGDIPKICMHIHQSITWCLIKFQGFLPDGRQIAVKRLDMASGQGLKELRNELLLVAKLRHSNLAKLLGVCLKGQEKLLVYEYMLNRSLDTFLFGTERTLPCIVYLSCSDIPTSLPVPDVCMHIYAWRSCMQTPRSARC